MTERGRRTARAWLACAFVVLAAVASTSAIGHTLQGQNPREDPRDDPDATDPRDTGARGDPLMGIVRRVDRYMQSNEVDGVVLDARYTVNETEAVRLSVVSQLLAYTELYKVFRTPRLRRDITDRADFLIDRFDAVRSGSVFDGMLGYSLFEAYAETREPRYLEYGRSIAQELMALPRGERVLNGGLMGVMALVDYVKLTGDESSLAFIDDVFASLPLFQHANGSFPHWCTCSTDIHYTDWMTTELILIQRVHDRPDIDPMLGRMRTFLEGRIDDRGVTHYVDSCSAYPGCVIPYYSIASGCSIDYDTRAWTNELGYSALLFDHFDSPTYGRVMRFMRSLEHHGTFPDKWDFWPPSSDPYYVWTAADTSVINTSLIFWSLASVLSGRHARGHVREFALDPGVVEPVVARRPPPPPLRAIGDPPSARRRRDAVDSLLVAGADPAAFCGATSGSPSATAGLGPLPPMPIGTATSRTDEPGTERRSIRVEIEARGSAGTYEIRFALPAAGPARLEILDAGGRRVRALRSGAFGAGEHHAVWDGRDGDGRLSPSGLYFAWLRLASEARSTRIAVVR